MPGQLEVEAVTPPRQVRLKSRASGIKPGRIFDPTRFKKLVVGLTELRH
jgi:hypothetical protein